MTSERIEELLSAFAAKRILVVGDMLLDRYVSGKVERLNPEAPVPILHAHEQIDQTGGAGNVAKNVATLGGQAVLIGVVGDDQAAREVAEAAHREHYEAHLITDSRRPTIRKVRYLVNGQQMLRVDWEEPHNIASDIEAQVNEQIAVAFSAGVDGVIVSDYAKGTITEAVARHIMELAREHTVPVAADVKPSRIGFFVGATFISPNTKEAHEYLGLNHLEQGGKRPEELGELLQKRFETDAFVTLGADGVYVCAVDGTRQHVPQEHVITIADTSGAGDASVAAMLLARLAGGNAVEMAEIANAAGAVVVSKIGAVGVNLDEVRDMLTHHHEGSDGHLTPPAGG